MKRSILVALMICIIVAGCSPKQPATEKLEKFFEKVASETREAKGKFGESWADGATLKIHLPGGRVFDTTKKELTENTKDLPSIPLKQCEILEILWNPETEITLVTVDHIYEGKPSNKGMYSLKKINGDLRIISFENISGDSLEKK